MTPPNGVRRRYFVDHVTAAVNHFGATIRWHSDDWIAEIESPTGRLLIIGQVFPLNNASAAHAANDKVATYSLLEAAGIGAVPHHLIRFPEDPLVATHQAVALCGGASVVIKPHRESSGIDVRRATDEPSLPELFSYYIAKYRAVAVSPWQEIRDEHRVVMLDDSPLLVYRKTLSGGPEWRHNLRFGARPDLDIDPLLSARLKDLARAVMQALTLRFASVDIVRVGDEPLILEVNGGVTLEHFSRTSTSHRRCAEEVYLRAIRACLVSEEKPEPWSCTSPTAATWPKM